MLNPMRNKKKARTGGESGRHLWPRFVQKISEGKTFNELGWEVKVFLLKNKIKYIYIVVLIITSKTWLVLIGERFFHFFQSLETIVAVSIYEGVLSLFIRRILQKQKKQVC